MLLAIDVGNTNIVIGIYDGEKLAHSWRASTRREKTADEFGILLKELFDFEGLTFNQVTAIVLASVVPPLDSAFRLVGEKYFGLQPLVVGHHIDLGIRILFDSPEQVGADRIVNAIAAFHRYGGPVIVVDFGTATTFDAISKDGDYLGGAIAPGIGISTEALFRYAAKLPRIDLVRPDKAIGRNTVAGMQSGIVFGYAGQVDAMVHRFRLELGQEARVVATGGLAELIAPESSSVQFVDPLLTLEGLRLVWKRNSLSQEDRGFQS